MNITMTKEFIVQGCMYTAGETVDETDEGRAKFLIAMGHAVAAASSVKPMKKTPVTVVRAPKDVAQAEMIGDAIANALRNRDNVKNPLQMPVEK